MKVLRSFAAAALLLAAAPLVTHAQHAETAAGESHAHVAPHGGVVRSAGSYHVELVAQPTTLTFYLLGAKMSAQPNNGMKGSVLVQLTNNKTATLPLKPAGTDQLTATLPAGASVRTAIVTLTPTGGKAITARFEKLDAPRAHQAVAAVYVCPMHPEVTSDKPGSCPKCHMALVKK
ncbi:hypothetical protein A0257_21985 [Hymenobacter psoromatis]|nr:hypothetical protein A0257_21985 [Hymenobacter psoromatis]